MLIGIDLGTTNSLVGAIDSGLPVLFAGKDGSRMTPSVVAFPETGDPIVGRDAIVFPGDVVRSVKRLMGENHPIQAGGRTRSPEEVSSLILRKLVDDAGRALGSRPQNAVITVPAYFNDAQRQATKRAAELASLEVERLLPEPTAAALAFGLDRKAGRFAVYDLGGGTFDLTVLELQDGVFHVLSTHGDTHLGGDDLDAAIAREFGISMREAEDLKRTATGDDLARVEAICQPVIERTRRLCDRALLDAGLTPDQLDEVILVGGATRMPLVRQMVKEIFGREPDTSQHPDEAVAIGAVLQAGVLQGSVQGVTLLDVTPLSLGIETYGGLMNVIIPRNTTIPTKAGEMFTNAASNQASMRITVLQGEREMAADNWKLGECIVPFPPAPRGQARVGVQFELDANGILHVLARDIASGTDTRLEISSAVDVSDEAVEKMLGDAVEHAFEDMDDRLFAEAMLKAEEMLPAVEAALLSSTPPEDELASIRSAEAAVRDAMQARSLRRLKSALEALDQATAPLAARILEDALARS